MERYELLRLLISDPLTHSGTEPTFEMNWILLWEVSDASTIILVSEHYILHLICSEVFLGSVTITHGFVSGNKHTFYQFGACPSFILSMFFDFGVPGIAFL